MTMASVLDLGTPFAHEPAPERPEGVAVLAGHPAHTLVTGQSGCGKSNFLARYIEEVLLCEPDSNILLFDLNYEFSGFGAVDDDASSGSEHVAGSEPIESFRDRWTKLAKSFKNMRSNDLKIHFKDLRNEDLLALMGISPSDCPDALWLLNAMDDHRLVIEKYPLRTALENAKRWTEGRLTQDEASDPELSGFAHEVRSAVKPTSIVHLINGSWMLEKQSNVSEDSNCLRAPFAERLFAATRFASADLLDFDYERYILRDLVTLHMLRLVWEKAKKRFVERKGGEPKKTLYLVVDEAHNIVPASGQRNALAGEVLNVIQTIAAEGRKFGLFLVLVTQRPSKIHQDVLSECDNFAVMRSTRPSIKHLKTVVPLPDEDSLEEVRSYTPGKVLLCGRFTDYRLATILSGIRRTRKRL
ncbi:MAG: ATP-binding protein [Planctomycetota bacterium]|jgi:hypothetical protein